MIDRSHPTTEPTLAAAEPLAVRSSAEKRTLWVAVLTFAAMFGEVFAGWWFNSLALLADGWHMGTHAMAVGLSAVAYSMARRYRADPRFAFGTWKIEVLAGYTSALLLAAVGAGMVWAAGDRFLDPKPIAYAEAMVVAALGLMVNLVCVAILGLGHDHGLGHSHGHGHAHGHGNQHGPAHAHDHGHAHGPHDHPHPHDPSRAATAAAAAAAGRTDRPPQDLNLRSAYLHVVADAATSVLAILALAGGLWFGWAWLDPAMSLVGAAMVLRWSRSLIGETGRVLLDCEMDHPVVSDIRHCVVNDATWSSAVELQQLQVWRIGTERYAAVLRLASRNAYLTPEVVREALLKQCRGLGQITVELSYRNA